MGKSNIKLLLRPAMLMLPFGLGIIFQLASNVSWKTASGTSLSLLLIRAGLMLMFYFVLLKIDFRKLVPVKEHIPVVMANAFMGVVPFLLLRALGYPDLALAAFFVWNVVTLIKGGGVYGGYTLASNIIGGWGIFALVLLSGFIVKGIAKLREKRDPSYTQDTPSWDEMD